MSVSAAAREPAGWSFRELTRPEVPVVATSPHVDTLLPIRNPIDAFVLRKLREVGLTPSPAANRLTLVRRLYFDLIGLPPTPEEAERFVNDTAEDAYERLVDELLASPHYGERWARHWLDVVRYADTCGYDKDKLRPNAWPYRDYVIRAFNDDKPYTRFVQEQIAGDTLFAGEPDGIVGLGFIAAGPWDFIGHVEVPEEKIDGQVARNLDRDDMVTSTLNTFCSVTVQCARCHDHKFDPFTQEHYYSLQAVFAAVDRAERPYGEAPHVTQRRSELTDRVAVLKRQLADLEKEAKTSADGGAEPLVAARDQHQLSQIAEQLQQAETELAEIPPAKMVYAAATQFPPQANFKPTGGKPRVVRLLQRGNILQPREEAPPGTLPLIPAHPSEFDLPPKHSEADRRVALAQWLTRYDNPLTWRSIVNRVWLYHFGRGIVNTPNDFGQMGERPTHPQLLDWLACEFRDGGQSLKSLHRLIVSSSVYRQTSGHVEKNAAIDSSNLYLWRMNRRRLEAEEIRDAILAVSGKLDRQMFGPGFYLFALEKTEHSPHYEYHKHDPEDRASHRRSIYRFVVRSQPDPFMTTFDCADSSQSTPIRNETTTPLQALSLLNNRFTLCMARHFASRLEREHNSLSAQVERGFQLTTSHRPTDAQRIEMLRYAEQHGLPNLCRLLFNLSEFVFVD